MLNHWNVGDRNYMTEFRKTKQELLAKQRIKQIPSEFKNENREEIQAVSAKVTKEVQENK